ncbi:uncharacterized protein LOC125213107 isoform X2 [Salvia hispanica]|uniref:uncharacterized protein LOC125213107 isoform X2 n=1 Tax=Salvia hispanica TaxID=49212 RepID=UPI00200981B0|nr:uncharacterized protein LOC125213107 isoform X2 [Salvia hispanica]
MGLLFLRGRRDCPLRSIPAGESQRVRLNRILELDDTTPIHVRSNGRIYDSLLHSDHILTMTRIVFKSEERADSSYELIAEGITETNIDRYFNFGSWIDWDNKIYDKLPPRPSSMVEPSAIYENNLPLRSSQRSNIVEPSVNENAQPLMSSEHSNVIERSVINVNNPLRGSQYSTLVVTSITNDNNIPLRNSPHPNIMEPSVINDNNPFLRSPQHFHMVEPSVVNENNIPLSSQNQNTVEPLVNENNLREAGDPEKNENNFQQRNRRERIIRALNYLRFRRLSNTSVESRESRVERDTVIPSSVLLLVLAFLMVGSMRFVLYNQLFLFG